MNPIRIIFMGTAELACATLEAVLAQPGFQVVAAVTQPDRPYGRNLEMHVPPVKELAQRHQLPIFQPERARDPGFFSDLQTLRPDLIVVAAYGQILPVSILELPAGGCLNVHASLLPRYRGAAPIQYALLNGDTTTGVTIMKMDQGMDTGPMLRQAELIIDAEDTAQTLLPRLAALGANLLVQTIPPYLRGEIIPQAQPAAGVSYSPKIAKAQGQVDWTQPACNIRNKLRAFTPWPGLFTTLPGPEKLLLKIWQATVDDAAGSAGQVLRADKDGIVIACGRAALRITVLQREGRRRMNAAEFLAGTLLAPGVQLS